MLSLGFFLTVICCHSYAAPTTKPWINLHKLNSSIDSEKDDNISTAWARIKTVSVNVANKRSKRSENFYWSNENIRKAQPHMPILNYVPNPVEVSSKCATNHAGDLPVYAADVTSYPFSTFGRLLHRVNGELHWCTAAFVHSNILITAAHCVKGSHGWHTDFQFFNQYNGVHDKGSKIELDHLFAPGSFVSPTGDIDYSYDYAFITTKKSSDVGNLGIRWSNFGCQAIKTAGYSRNYYMGEKMVFTVGYKEQYDKYLHFPKNPMDKGCSGGPWIEKEPSGYYVVGLNSHMLLGAVIKGLFSPQFNIHTRTLFNDAKAHAELNTKKNDRGFEVEEDRTFDHIEENGNFDNIEEGTGLGYAEEDRNSVDVEEDTEDIFEDYSSAECTLICPIWCDKTNHALCVKFETRTGCSCLSW